MNYLTGKYFKIKLIPIFHSMNIENYFKLKSCASYALASCVLYQFSASCDANPLYMPAWLKKHLNFSDFQFKKLLLKIICWIVKSAQKNLNPNLYKQFYAEGSTILLSVF